MMTPEQEDAATPDELLAEAHASEILSIELWQIYERQLRSILNSKIAKMADECQSDAARLREKSKHRCEQDKREAA